MCFYYQINIRGFWSRYKICLGIEMSDTFILNSLLIGGEIEIGAISVEVLNVDLTLVHMIEIKSFSIGWLDEHSEWFDKYKNVRLGWL